MSYDRLQAEILLARDHREALITDALQSVCDPLIVVSLNIPGPNKTPAGAQALYEFALDTLRTRLSPLQSVGEDSDTLGPLALLVAFGRASDDVKRQCVELEHLRSVMRLVDLDVYAGDGCRIGRREIGLPPRQCLLCNCEVTECMRLRRHTCEELVHHVHTLLKGESD